MIKTRDTMIEEIMTLEVIMIETKDQEVEKVTEEDDKSIWILEYVFKILISK